MMGHMKTVKEGTLEVALVEREGGGNKREKGRERGRAQEEGKMEKVTSLLIHTPCYSLYI